jgi:D-2-hydroxyacid dehydrogenase (NADP+)
MQERTLARVLVGPNAMGLEQVIDQVASLHPDWTFRHCAQPEALAQALTEADIYLGWLNREQFQGARSLRWIQSPSSGVDRFLTIPELANGDVILTSARGTHGACLAEHAFAMILAFTRGIRWFVDAQHERRWAGRDYRSRLVELTGSTMGIIGFGTVGRALAKRAAAFDMRIIAVDAFPCERPDYVASLEGLEGLDTLLAQSDYLVVTVPYTEKNQNLIGATQLSAMKASAMLVGISRGGIIDEDALAQALREGRIAAAALDVCCQEPLPADSPLWDVQNLLITPHVAGGTQFECGTILAIFAENLDRYQRGEFPLRNQVDKARGF